MSDYTIGIDFGGTKILTALVDANGRILHEVSAPVTPVDSPQLDPRHPHSPTDKEVKMHVASVVSSMADSVAECAKSLNPRERARIRGIGLASAGPMDLGKGLLIDSSNWKGWKKVPIIDKLEKACGERELPASLKKRAHFQNDAIASALGEGWIGTAKNKSTYVMITVGTGVGTGVILNGKPAQSQGRGCEWGHLLCDMRDLTSRINDADQGTPDRMVSGTGLVRQAQARGFTEFKTAQEIADAARKGDKRARGLLRESSEALASLFYSLSLGFNPEVFSVSGGLLAMKDLFLPDAIDIYQRAIRVRYPSFECPIRLSKLGSKIGVVGAARLPRL